MLPKKRAGERRPHHHFRHHAGQGVLRDVGRVMGMSYADVDRIAKMIRLTRNDP